MVRLREQSVLASAAHDAMFARRDQAKRSKRSGPVAARIAGVVQWQNISFPS